MSSNFKRSVARGFTLIELLIVVIILAILAAIAIPQFSASTSDAQLSALDANLATVRSAMEQYKVQHANQYPGAVASASTTTCTNGTAVAAAIGEPALTAQLKGYSNSAGQLCSAQGGDFKYGPYLRQGLPTEPVSGKADVVVTATGAAITPGTVGGWAYDSKSGQFIVNNSANDTGTPVRKLSDH